MYSNEKAGKGRGTLGGLPFEQQSFPPKAGHTCKKKKAGHKYKYRKIKGRTHKIPTLNNKIIQ
jgi:hypothetical protein